MNSEYNMAAAIRIGKVEKILKLRVQNICCGKESTLIKNKLDKVVGILSVRVNVVGRLAFINYDESIISATTIIDDLNSLHLGISLMEAGHNTPPESSHYGIALRASMLVTMTLLFVVVIISHTKNYSWEKWVAIPLIVLGSLPMLWKMFIDVRRRMFVNMNSLMLIAVIGTVCLQEWIDGCIIVYIITIANILEAACKEKVEKNISALMLTVPKVAIIAETNKSVPVEHVDIGTVILVCAGEHIPLDGKVIKGQAAVDESSITGEAIPISKQVDSMVYSGSILQNGYLKIETTCDYQSSTISRVTQLMEEAQMKSSRSEEVLNKFAKFYTPCILLAAFFVFFVPFVIYEIKYSEFTPKEIHFWGTTALTVLVISCPCALIMSAPIPMTCGLTIAATNGILIKGGMYLEKMATINAVAFDKTGTLTEGRFQVIEERVVGPSNRDDTLSLVASLETRSAHPIAAAIVNLYSGCITNKLSDFGAQLGLPETNKFKNENGMGLSGSVNGQFVLVGNLELMQQHNVLISEDCITLFNTWLEEGCTVIFAAVDNQLELIFGLADKCRPSAELGIKELRDSGIETLMLTGDNEGSAQMIANKIGLSQWISNMKPNEKYQWILDKQKEKKTYVAMIGDGVNDSPSLAAADVGIAIGPTATALAVESAGISLMSDDLVKIADLIALSKMCKRVIYQNIIGSLVIKTVFVVVAFSTKSFLGLAVAADVVGLLFVLLNGLRPLKWRHKGRYEILKNV